MFMNLIKKLKPVFLLLFMTAICVVVVVIVNIFKKDSEVVYMENITNQSVLAEEMAVDTFEVEDVGSIEETKDSEESKVLSASSSNTNYSCNRNDFVEIKTESVCYREEELKEGFFESEGAKLIGGDKVSVNAEIILSKVTIPLELFSGVEVRDSNRLIEKETPTLKPAGEQIDEKVANINLPPSKQIEEYKEIVEDKPFKNEYSTAFADNEDLKSESGNIGVENELGNACEDEIYNNKSNVNPQKSNTISEFLQDSFYRSPGEKERKVVETIDECSQNATFTKWEWQGNQEYVACKANIVTQAIERFKSITSWGSQIGNIIKCQFASDDDPDCIKVEDIMIIMSSPFGSDEDCAEGSACTNTYMNTRNAVVSAPGADLGPKQYYLTPCKAYIQGLKYQATVWCAWDMSHLFKERKVNEFDDLPTVDATPTDEEYNDFLLDKVKGTRGVARSIE